LAATADTLLAKINLTWQDNSLVEQGYKIYVNTVNTKPATPQKTVAANTTSSFIDGLAYNTTYYIWVEAYAGTSVSSSATAQATTTSGRVAYWKFNENVADSSGNGNNGTISGTATWKNGVDGKALYFNGSTVVNVSTMNNFPAGMQPYTIEAWVKPDVMGVKGIIGWGNYGVGNQVNALRLTATGLVNYWWGNDLTVTTSSLTGGWVYVVSAFDGTTRRIYVDGVLVGSDNPVGHNASLNNLTIGKTYSTEYFQGVIDEMAVWKRSLSSDEVVSHYNSYISSSEAIARFNMDDGSTSSIADSSGNGYVGTIDRATPVAGQGVKGSGAYQFSWATQNKISVAYNSAQALVGKLTVEAWIYPTAWDNIYAHFNRIVSKQPVYLIRAYYGNANFVVITQSGLKEAWGPYMALNQWHYVVGTYDGSTIKIYVDGVLSASSAATGNIADNTNPICIGESPGLNEGFSGRIDNVAVYKRAKTASEITTTYNQLK
jgi:hypothetical protein